MKRETIIERLRKIKALSEEGVGGERAAAEQLLASMMKQYGISPDELEGDAVEYRLAYVGDGPYDYKLFVQIAYKFHYGPGKPRIADLRKAPAKYKKQWADAGLGPKNANVGLHCTKAEFIEIVSIFELYKVDLVRQMAIFYYAYLDKNNLLLPVEGESPDLTDEEIDRLLSAERMKTGIKKQELYKQIEAK